MKKLFAILCVLAMLCMLCVPAMAAGTTKLYCAAPANWENCNVYWWGSAGSNPTWPGEAMTKGTDGLWYYEVPSDAGNVIFNNGSAQSADLDMPKDNKVQFNYDAKTWVAYGSEVEVVETKYFLRGSMNSWGTDNEMTKQADGTYVATLTLSAGSYEYKAGTEDWGWSCPADANATLTLEADSSVTFTLDLAANTITANGDNIGEDAPVEQPTTPPAAPSLNDLYIVGSGIPGVGEWNPADANGIMDEISNGVFVIELDLTAGSTMKFKFAGNGDWNSGYNFGSAAFVLGEAADLTNDGGSSDMSLTADADMTVKITVNTTALADGGAATILVEQIIDEPVVEPTEEVTEPTEEVTEPSEEVTEPSEEVTEPTEDDGMITVYFDALNDWTTVNLYYWGVDGAPSWPGVAMTDEDGDGWYEYKVPMMTNNIIVNDGSMQSVDMTMDGDADAWLIANGMEGDKITCDIFYENPGAAGDGTSADLTAPTDPSVEPTEPSTEATEPSTEATEPSTEATEATDPSTEAPTTAPATQGTTQADIDAQRAKNNKTALIVLGISLVVIIGIACVMSIPKKIT